MVHAKPLPEPSEKEATALTFNDEPPVPIAIPTIRAQVRPYPAPAGEKIMKPPLRRD